MLLPLILSLVPDQTAAAPAVNARQPAPIPRSAPATGDVDDDDDRRKPNTEITVTARRLDQARLRIEPTLAASVYSLTNDAIEARPGGETGNLRSVLLQAPGVARDASGALIVRGATAGVQFRLNNIILPDSGGDLGESLSARLADRTDLITGALPAQYGLTSGAVVNVTTKNGHYLVGGQAELYGGSQGTVQPAAEWSHATGGSSLYLSGSLRDSRLGSPPPTRDGLAHDGRREAEGFAFFDHLLNADSRVSLIVGTVNERQEIAGPGAAIADAARFGTSTRHDHYGAAAYQFDNGPLSLLVAIHGLIGQARVAPDEAARVATDGFSFARGDKRWTVGGQVEAAWTVSPAHTLRAGMTEDVERLLRRDRTATSAAVTQDRTALVRHTISGFVEDSWTVIPAVEIVTGARADRVDDTDPQLAVQPRAGLVWTLPHGLTTHLGYARSARAPALEEEAQGRLSRSDLFDAGAQQRVGDLTVGVDAYLRYDRDLAQPRYRADAPVAADYYFARARSVGVELIGTYADGPVAVWANLAFAHATGTGLQAGAATTAGPVPAGDAGATVPLDTDQRVVASGGASYRLGELRFSVDASAASGTPRTVAGGDVHRARNSAYALVDAAVVWRVDLLDGHPTDLRMDVRNILDRRALLSDGTGLRGGPTAWTEPRGLYAGIEQAF